MGHDRTSHAVNCPFFVAGSSHISSVSGMEKCMMPCGGRGLCDGIQ